MPLDPEALETFIPHALRPLELGNVEPFESFRQHGRYPLSLEKTACPTDRICHTTLNTHSGHAPWESVPLEATLTDFREETKIFRRYFGLVPRT